MPRSPLIGFSGPACSRPSGEKRTERKKIFRTSTPSKGKREKIRGLILQDRNPNRSIGGFVRFHKEKIISGEKESQAKKPNAPKITKKEQRPRYRETTAKFSVKRRNLEKSTSHQYGSVIYSAPNNSLAWRKKKEYVANQCTVTRKTMKLGEGLRTGHKVTRDNRAFTFIPGSAKRSKTVKATCCRETRTGAAISREKSHISTSPRVRHDYVPAKERVYGKRGS